METVKTTFGVLLGIGVGVALGVLFAPAKGKKTRKRILHKGQDYVDELKGKFDDLYEEATDKYENLLEEAQVSIAEK